MATATAIPVDVKARSIELAQARGYHRSGPAQSIGLTLDEQGQLVSYAVRVPSASVSEQWHIATYQAAGGRVSCDCRAGQMRHACWHVGCLLGAVAYIERRIAHHWEED